MSYSAGDLDVNRTQEQEDKEAGEELQDFLIDGEVYCEGALPVCGPLEPNETQLS